MSGDGHAFRSVKQHTHTSAVRLTCLPESVEGTRRTNGAITRVAVRIKDAPGGLLATAIPTQSAGQDGR